MLRSLSRTIFHLMFGATLSVIAGCAAVPHDVDLIYRPVTHMSGGSGRLYLDMGHGEDQNVGKVLWVVGRIENPDGTESGRITSDLAPGDLLRDAFAQELGAAGYQVEYSEHLAEESGPGISLDQVGFMVTETPSVVTAGTSCTVSVTVGIWKSGKKIAVREFSTSATDRYAKGDPEAVNDTVEKAIATLMTTAVPEIMGLVGG